MSVPVRVLAGVLHVGEPSLPRTIASLESQVGVVVDLYVIGHQPKWEAHRQLFERFDSDDGAHDVLIKVDADMDLVHPALIRSIGQMFGRFPHIDQAVIGVDDWFSGERIMGLTAWRGGTHWTSPPPELFTDLATSTSRGKFKIIDPGFPLVVHGADPTEDQALRYGAHRALKAAATRALSRLNRLDHFARFAVDQPLEGRLIALAAAERSLSDESFGRRCIDGTAAPTVEDRAYVRRRSAEPTQLLEALLVHTSRLRSDGDVDDDTVSAANPAPRRSSNLLRRARARLGGRVADQATMTQVFITLL